MYLRMDVGVYQGEVRGPFDIQIGRHLIASGQATKAEFDPESGGFKVPEVEIESAAVADENQIESPAAPTSPKKGRR